jgi:enoyl-CoA hydratase
MTVRLTRSADLATIHLARPAVRNALTEAMADDFARVIDELARDTPRLVVLRGDGNAFCAGGDLSFIDARLGRPVDENARAMRSFYQRFLGLRTLPAPTLAVIHGAAMGAGVCMALACDRRIAAEDARMSLNFVKLGLSPGMGATALLPALIGPSRATDLLSTGRVVDAHAALAMGLVDAVHPFATLDAAIATFAKDFSAGSAAAVAATVRLVRHRLLNLEEALDAEARAQAELYNLPDIKERLAAARRQRA